MHRFPYEWYLSDGYPANGIDYHGSKVFSCFACGGGSTMGYKLAGYDVIGCNEIDPKMMKAYKANHHPKYDYLEPIQEFKDKENLPDELYNLDILDGSPPCSSFSMAGNRSKDWGKKKKFREGQAEQVLDTLFFDFIDLADRLQPKIVVAENVKGLLQGDAWQYLKKVYDELEDAGYYVQHFLLDASEMGVPQRRERVFIIGLRKDLAQPFLKKVDFFHELPEIELEFNEDEITFSEFSDESDTTVKDDTKISSYYDKVDVGESFSTAHPKGHFFGDYKLDPNSAVPTVCADPNHGGWHHNIKRMMNNKESILASSFPIDYNFIENNPKYICGMSVPPIMMAQVAYELYTQWVSKL